jgi:hypothetical protein
MKTQSRNFAIATTMLTASALAGSAALANVEFSASDADGRSASATFAVGGGNLQITLTSVGEEPTGSWNGTYGLTALFLNTDLALNSNSKAPITGDSAIVGAGGGVIGTIPTGNTIGSYSSFGVGLTGVPLGATEGLQTAGFNDNNPANGNLGPPPSEKVDGLDGAILGWINVTGADSSVTGHEPLAYDSIVFTLTGSGRPNVLSTSDFTDVSFMYGTMSGSDNLDGVPVPEPSTLLAGVLLLLPFGATTLRILRRRRS